MFFRSVYLQLEISIMVAISSTTSNSVVPILNLRQKESGT